MNFLTYTFMILLLLATLTATRLPIFTTDQVVGREMYKEEFKQTRRLNNEIQITLYQSKLEGKYEETEFIGINYHLYMPSVVDLGKVKEQSKDEAKLTQILRRLIESTLEEQVRQDSSISEKNSPSDIAEMIVSKIKERVSGLPGSAINFSNISHISNIKFYEAHLQKAFYLLLHDPTRGSFIPVHWRNIFKYSELDSRGSLKVSSARHDYRAFLELVSFNDPDQEGGLYFHFVPDKLLKSVTEDTPAINQLIQERKTKEQTAFERLLEQEAKITQVKGKAIEDALQSYIIKGQFERYIGESPEDILLNSASFSHLPKKLKIHD